MARAAKNGSGTLILGLILKGVAFYRQVVLWGQNSTNFPQIASFPQTLEHGRDMASSKDPYFDYTEVLLRIAIVMATVAILSQSRAIFGVSLIAAMFGTLLGLNGFFLLVRLPFLSH